MEKTGSHEAKKNYWSPDDAWHFLDKRGIEDQEVYECSYYPGHHWHLRTKR